MIQSDPAAVASQCTCLLQPSAPIRREREIWCVLWSTASRPFGASVRRSRQRAGTRLGAPSPSCGRDVQMPDGRGSLFDVLDRAAARGLDVRVLFWRAARAPPPRCPSPRLLPEPRRTRRARRTARSRFLARWDRTSRAFCQHQKSWIDRCRASRELAFVGGINLDRFGRVARRIGTSDTRCARATPASRRLSRDRRAGVDGRCPQLRPALERGQRTRAVGRLLVRAPQRRATCPSRHGSPRRSRPVPVQITRTVHAGSLQRRPSPRRQAAPFAIDGGERSASPSNTWRRSMPPGTDLHREPGACGSGGHRQARGRPQPRRRNGRAGPRRAGGMVSSRATKAGAQGFV